jgi:hypothetical protein
MTTKKQAGVDYDLAEINKILDAFPIVSNLMLQHLMPKMSNERIKKAISYGKRNGKLTTREDGLIHRSDYRDGINPDNTLAYWIYLSYADSNVEHQFIGGKGESELFFTDGELLHSVVIVSDYDIRSRSLRLSDGTLDADDSFITFAFIATPDATERVKQYKTILERIVPPVRAGYRVVAVELGRTLNSKPNLIELDTSNLERRL